MTTTLRLIVGVAALGAIAGCVETSEVSTSTGVSMRTAPQTDELACLQAVSGTTGNGVVEVIRSETSEANNFVVVGVGDQRAPWNCLVNDGQVVETYFAGNEGTL